MTVIGTTTLNDLNVSNNSDLNTVTISNTLTVSGITEHKDIVIINTISGDETIDGILPSHSKYAANIGFVLEAVSKSEEYKVYDISETSSKNIDLPFDIE